MISLTGLSNRLQLFSSKVYITQAIVLTARYIFKAILQFIQTEDMYTLLMS